MFNIMNPDVTGTGTDNATFDPKNNAEAFWLTKAVLDLQNKSSGLTWVSSPYAYLIDQDGNRIECRDALDIIEGALSAFDINVSHIPRTHWVEVTYKNF